MRPVLRSVLLISAVWPMTVLAQDFDIGAAAPPKAPSPLFTSAIEIGAGYQNTDSFFFGRYGGLTRKGAFGFADGDISRRSPWDTGDGTYFGAGFRFNGEDSPSASLLYGKQGQWRIGASFDSFTIYDTNTARTPFDGVGSSQLTLPSNWVGTASSLFFPSLQADLKPAELKVRWRTTGGDYVLDPRPGYEVRIHFDHRDRDGLKYSGIAFGQESNFPVGIFFPQPIDYHSNHVVVSLGYADLQWQWKASYSLATFDDDLSSMSVPNPYTRSLGTPWTAGAFAGYPFAIGQYSTPPDSTSHQIALTGGYALTPQMRLTAKASYTIQTQNDPFLPYTDNPNLAVTTPLPRASLDGDVRKTFVNVTLTAHQGRSLDFTAAYTFDDRDNRTPQALYGYVPNDVQDQPPAALNGVSRYIRYNLPHSFTFHQAKAEIGYRLAPRTRLTLSYNGDFRSRTFQEVAHTTEHTVRAKAQTTFDRGSAWMSYTFATRSGSDYLDYLPWNDSHTANYLAAGPQTQSIEYPLLRKYNLADRHRHEVKAGASFEITAALNADVSGAYAKDDYLHSQFGLRSADSFLGDIDLAYTIKDRLTATAFYTFERMLSEQQGYFLFTASLTNPSQAWTAGNRDRTQSLGVKVDWKAVSDTLKLELSYYLSAGNTHIDVAGSTFVPFTPLAVVTPLPDAVVTTHNVGLNAEYAIKPSLAVRIGYTFEHHVTDDWRFISSLTPVSQILGSGEAAPRYNAHVVWVSTRTRF